MRNAPLLSTCSPASYWSSSGQRNPGVRACSWCRAYPIASPVPGLSIRVTVSSRRDCAAKSRILNHMYRTRGQT